MPRLNGRRDPRMSPAAYLGGKLKAGRVAAGFTSQEALADALGFERTTIAKVESGERPPSDAVLEAWCAACQLDLERFQELTELARATGGPVPTWFETWLAAEYEAHLLRYWSPILISPLAHTAEYARAIFLATQTDISDEAIDALVEARLKRQEILQRPDPPEVVMVMHELVLHRLIGSPEIMHVQLTRLVELSERPNVQVLIVPTEVGATAALSGPIDLASVDAAPDVLHTDATPEGHTTESRSVVRQAAVAFERVRAQALSQRQSRDLILTLREKLWTP